MATAMRQVRNEWSAAGFFGFNRTNVKYAHNGIQNLKHYVPIAQIGWFGELVSGTFTVSFSYDGGTSRTPVTITCSSPGVYKVRTRVQLPKDFGSIPASGLSIVTRRNAAITHLKLTMEKGGSADSAVNGVSVSPASSSTWETFTFSPSGGYSPGEFLTFTVEFSADTASDVADVADLSLTYVNKRGNV